MLVLVKKARSATQGDTSMEWLKPFMTERKYRKGDILMKKGDAAAEMLLTVTGKFRVIEINVELPPGRLMGELGFLTPDNRRTATIECIEDGHVLTITYEKLLEIYFQNPQFGYYFLVLTSQRLLENIARLEAILAQNKNAQQPVVRERQELSASPDRDIRSLERGQQIGLDGADADFVTPVERPLLDAFRHHQFSLDQHPHVFAQGGLGDPELLGDQQRADAVLDQIAVDLRRKMRAGILQPVQDRQPPLIGEGLDDVGCLHFVNLLIP